LVAPNDDKPVPKIIDFGLAKFGAINEFLTKDLLTPTEAEPLLLKGCDGMKAREKTIPPQGAIRIPEALDRLIELYTVTNKPDEVKKWQAELTKYPDTKPARPVN
jgi:hypothetical protein